MPIKCTHCEKEFSHNDALLQHVEAKHPEHAKKPTFSSKTKNHLLYWGIPIVVIILVSTSIWYFGAKERGDAIAEEIGGTANAETNSIPNSPIHWHPELTIIINREEQPIPANIGLNPGAHAPVHTHETNGTLHLENNYPSENNMRLGYFFDLWNKEFSSECIFDYCTDKGTLKMTVNGQENNEFENYIMADGDIIVVEYTSFNTT